MSVFNTSFQRRRRKENDFDPNIDQLLRPLGPNPLNAQRRDALDAETELTAIMAGFGAESKPVTSAQDANVTQAISPTGAQPTPVPTAPTIEEEVTDLATPPDSRDVRRARLNLSSDIRSERIGSRKLRQDLARDVRDLRRAGRNTEAEQIQDQIKQIANQGNADVDQLRNLLELERSLSPRLSTEQRLAGREALNAQLPGIQAGFEQQRAEQDQSNITRLAEVGAQAVRLETGLDPSDFSPEALAQFAQSASPEVIDRVTRGVGLPPVLGGVGDVQGLIDQGGVDFGPISEPRPLDQTSITSALDFLGEQKADRTAAGAIKTSERNLAVTTAIVAETEADITAGLQRKVARGEGIPLGAPPTDGTASQFGPPGNLEEEIITGNVFPEGTSDAAIQSVIGVVRSIQDGSTVRGLLKSANKTQGTDFDSDIESALELFDIRGIDRQFRRDLAQKMLDQLEDPAFTQDIDSTGFFEAIGDFGQETVASPGEILRFFTPSGAVGTERKAEKAQKLENFKSRLRSIISGR